MPKIFIVEDDQAFCNVLSQGLLSEKYSLEFAHNGHDALEWLSTYTYDLVILDWGLPVVNGVNVCEALRSKGCKTPILMLTGNSSINEKERGFEAGADDYLTKPFDLRELKMRVRALLRRPVSFCNVEMEAGGVLLRPAEHKVLLQGSEVQLSPKEFALLEFLMRHSNEVFSSADLLKAVWSADEDVGEETIRVHIKNLRSKLEKKFATQLISTVFGVGYRFAPAGDNIRLATKI